MLQITKFRLLLTLLGFFFITTHTAYAQFENCTNGVDDDNDGLIDCFDPNCASSPACQGVEINCNDGIDNDGDGLPDCLDDDCYFSGVCPIETDCGNGIDDDGDGFFDYYDGDCLDDPNNPNKYITSISDCEVRPQGNVFDIETEWQSEPRSSGVYAIPTVADLDQDGIPEIISTNERGRSMTILSGSDGTTLNSITFNEEIFAYPAVADVDNDGFGEIFIFDRNGNLSAYNHDLTPYWPGPRGSSINDGRMINIADFNQDGRAEIYYVNEIRDARNGSLIIKGTHGNGSNNRQWDDHVNGVSVAVDILPDSYCDDCQGLELVLGNIIYAVDIENQQLTEVLNMDNAASKVLLNPINGFTYASDAPYRPKKAQFGSQNFSSTSIVDLNEDGNLDVVLSGTLRNSTRGPSMIFFWDIANDAVRARIITRPFSKIPGKILANFNDVNGNACNAADGECTWRRGMGSLNIANIDDDPELEITFMSGSSLYALSADLTEEWANHDDFWETSSGFTGTTVFDFDGDGSSEVVYRDEIDLYIVDGTTGMPLNQKVSGTFCSSQTQAEYPVVADVDGDGETEIIVACGCLENTRKVLRTNNSRNCGFIRAYKAANNNFWVPSRKLWNQFAYFNVNINDDLTIPRFQQYHHIGFAQKCSLLGAGTGFSLNKFLNQSPVINYCGNLTFPSPNLEFADDPIQISPPVCPDERFQVRLRFTNTGDETAFKDVPVSFYADDPAQSYSDAVPNPHLETQYLNIAGGLQVGQIVDTVIWVNGRAGDFRLFVSLNDIGPFDLNGSSLSNSAFYPLDSLNGTIRECDASPTVISADVAPYPFNTTALLIKDNDFCPGSFNSNGAITAHVAGDTLGYVFRWYEGSNTSGAPLFIGATQRNLTGGTYTVVAHHTLANCTGNAASVVVRDLSAPPVIDAQVVAQQTSCDASRPNGALRGYVLEAGQQVTAGYNFFWYRGENTVVPARSGYTGGPEADQLSAGTYRLVVEHATTGCRASMDVVLGENITTPDLDLESVQHLTVCDPARYDGRAAVSVNGNTSDYDFYWYRGNVSSPDTTSSSSIGRSAAITGLDDGRYTVFAAHKLTRCLSDGLRIRIRDNTWNPVVATRIVNAQQACDPALANGSLSAAVDESSRGGSSSVTSGYTFEWYQGTFSASSLPATPAATGSTADSLVEGPYTLITRSDATGCQTLTHVTLPAQPLRPVLDPGFTLTHADNCTDPWGSEIVVSADGGKTAADGYRFQWRDISTNTLLADTSHILSNVPPGSYGVTVSSPLACTSLNEVEIIIRDEAPKPVVNLQTVPNSSCDASQPNGMLIARDFTGTASDYTFEWFYTSPGGAAVEPAKVVSSGDTVKLLAAGNYALRIRDNSSQCFSIAYASIGSRSGVVPTLDTLYTQATTDCRPAFANGEVAFQLPTGKGKVPPQNTVDRTYTFELYAGTGVSGSPLLTNDNGLFTGLNQGAYTAIVRDDYNHCTSAPVTIDIDKAPGVSVTIDTFIPSSACASADGSLGITASSANNNAPTGAGYTFQWYYRQAGDPLPGTSNPGTVVAQDAFSSSRTDLPSGYYLIEVYDNFSNCLETFEFFLPNADPPQISSSNVVDASQCSPGNGTITIDAVSTAVTLDNFDVILYQSSTVDPSAQLEVWMPLPQNSQSYSFSDLEPGDYTIAFVENFGGNCFSTIEHFHVPNATPEAVISFAHATDYSCNSSGTGSISVSNISRNGSSESLSGFSYAWYAGSSATGPVLSTQATADNLSSGNYTVEVTDTDGTGIGCSYTATTFLDNVPRLLAVTGIDVVPNTLCTGSNGEISISGITEDGNAVPVSGYTLNLLDDNLSPLPSGTYSGNGQPATPFANLAEGTYYVEAVNNATGCSVISAAVVLITDTYLPQVSLVSDFPDFSCSGGLPTGELSVAALSQADGDASNFDFQWFDASGNPLGSASSISGLAAGRYTVVVTDTDGHSLGCSRSATFEVLPASREILFTLSGVDPTFCDPANGELFVESISERYIHRGNSFTDLKDVNDYDFSLLDAELAALGNAGRGTQADPFTGLDEGTFYVQAQNSSTDNCLSAPVSLSLQSLCTPPVVDIVLNSPQYSQNPDPSTWTGSLTAVVSESDDNPVDSASNNFDYTYEWYRADDYLNGGGSGSGGGTASPIGTGPSINGLDAGPYVLVVRNNVTGAVTEVTYNLERVIIEPELIASANPQTVCFANGSIALTSLSFNGTADDPAKYTLFIYEDESLSLVRDSVKVQQFGETLFSDLWQGAYYLRARHDDFFVYSNIYEVEVDNRSVDPLIDLDLDKLLPQMSCQPEILATGKLAVIVSELDGSSHEYRYQWYEGNQPLPEHIIEGEGRAVIDSLPAGFYTVEVFNTQTLCSSVRTFFVEEQIEIPVVEAAASAATVCDPALANGQLTASVLQPGNYSFAWYRGSSAAGLPEHIGQTWGGLMPGIYTVVATDMITGTCSSAPVSVELEDASQVKPLSVETVAPNSACDPALANGVLSASVEGPISEYSFSWYDEHDSLLVSDASMIGDLSEGRYRLEAIYLPTGCRSQAWGQIYHEPAQYEAPTVSIETHMSNCAQPDGSATVRMFEENESFVFSWFDAQGQPLPEVHVQINENDFSSVAVNLAAGTYFVEAFDLSTGCYTPRSQLSIEDRSYVPAHSIEADAADCELSNGSLRVIPKDDVIISNIEWRHELSQQTFAGTYYLKDAPAGSYSYTITWQNGCSSYGSTFLPADLNIFNGLSPNGDGENDYFHIDCIEEFPQNSVKIFNRAGALVYEADAYDNKSIVFEGLGNRG
ncbi:MAG: gliding motility-associated C-terminal domain-containing protein, partial [Cyclobacteriaceae bacterium]